MAVNFLIIYIYMSNKKIIKHIKIFGERNSGTNFLTQLIEKNIQDINILSFYYKGGTGWKHGFPRIELFKELDSTLFIFIIRDLDNWIKSMYFNVYCYKKPNNIEQFLTEKIKINDKRLDHDVNIYEAENQNIIHLRNSKIKSYLNFFKNISNGVFINLEHLQENDKKFLLFLNSTYNLNIKEYNPIKKHTKNNIECKNRKYNLILPKIIHKDIEIENFVTNLKTKYYYKVSNVLKE